MLKPTIQDTVAYMKYEKPKHTKPHQAFYDCAIEELPNVPRWIPVSEKLPMLDSLVLCSMLDGTIDVGYHYEHHWTTGRYPSCVIAWQPLPKPYKSEDKADD